VHCDIERRRLHGEVGERPREILARNHARELVDCSDRGAGGGRVARIRLDQHCRAIAAYELRREVRWNRDDELRGSALECCMRFGFVGRVGHDPEIVGCLQGGDERAREFAVIGHDHRGRHVLRVGVDRVTEKRQLDDRDPDDHRECDAVARELEEFLDEHRHPAL
jgi:hypothetical protein